MIAFGESIYVALESSVVESIKVTVGRGLISWNPVEHWTFQISIANSIGEWLSHCMTHCFIENCDICISGNVWFSTLRFLSISGQSGAATEATFGAEGNLVDGGFRPFQAQLVVKNKSNSDSGQADKQDND